VGLICGNVLQGGAVSVCEGAFPEAGEGGDLGEWSWPDMEGFVRFAPARLPAVAPGMGARRDRQRLQPWRRRRLRSGRRFPLPVHALRRRRQHPRDRNTLLFAREPRGALREQLRRANPRT
jgi:hypothetical protein